MFITMTTASFSSPVWEGAGWAAEGDAPPPRQPVRAETANKPDNTRLQILFKFLFPL